MARRSSSSPRDIDSRQDPSEYRDRASSRRAPSKQDDGMSNYYPENRHRPSRRDSPSTKGAISGSGPRRGDDYSRPPRYADEDSYYNPRDKYYPYGRDDDKENRDSSLAKRADPRTRSAEPSRARRRDDGSVNPTRPRGYHSSQPPSENRRRDHGSVNPTRPRGYHSSQPPSENRRRDDGSVNPTHRRGYHASQPPSENRRSRPKDDDDHRRPRSRSTYSDAPPTSHRGPKAALAAAAAAVTGKHNDRNSRHHRQPHGRHSKDDEDEWSDASSADSRAWPRDASRRGVKTPLRPLQETSLRSGGPPPRDNSRPHGVALMSDAARCAVEAGAMMALRVRHEPGSWMGAKGTRVASAAAAAALVDTFMDRKHPRKKGGMRHMAMRSLAQAALGNLVVQPLAGATGVKTGSGGRGSGGSGGARGKLFRRSSGGGRMTGRMGSRR